MFKKILIANRAEIAVRIIRACKELGIKTVAVYSEADAECMHAKLADESICIGPNAGKDSYLNMQSVLAAAVVTNSDAIHPGVGFLSENARFAQMCFDHNITFIGPAVEHLKIMGDKILAKKQMTSLGVPTVEGIELSEGSFDMKRLQNQYPVIIKAAFGGGGRGMKVAYTEATVAEALKLAQAESQANFGRSEVYIERYLSHPRHIEIQILADQHHNVLHLNERDCSLQRRHQKIIEEAPCPILTPAQREKIGLVAVKAMRGMGYVGAGTLEFLYQDGEFYFIEMNTRVQVEHTITEEITGIDIIKYQIIVAAGEHLPFKQSDVQIRGHAIECRVNAENPRTFLPSPGRVTRYHPPGGPGIRIDSHLYADYKIPPYYDSLLAKLIAVGSNRAEAIARMKRAISEYIIDGPGVQTLLPLFQHLFEDDAIITGIYDVHTIESTLARNQIIWT